MSPIRNATNVNCWAANGTLICGSATSPLEDIIFNNLKLEFIDNPLNDVASGNVDLRGALVPKPAYLPCIRAFLTKPVHGLAINGFQFDWTRPRAARPL